MRICLLDFLIYLLVYHFYPLVIQDLVLSSVPKSLKLQLQPFDGSGPLDWLFQTEEYFQFHHTAPEQRLELIDFYMKGEALSWFKWMRSEENTSELQSH